MIPRMIKTAAGRFARDERGAILVETVLALPMLIWAYMGLFVFWDAFQTANALQKASYMAADFVTRGDSTTTTQLTGLRTAMDYMINADNQPYALIDAGVTFSPLYGKVAVLGDSIINFDGFIIKRGGLRLLSRFDAYVAKSEICPHQTSR